MLNAEQEFWNKIVLPAWSNNLERYVEKVLPILDHRTEEIPEQTRQELRNGFERCKVERFDPDILLNIPIVILRWSVARDFIYLKQSLQRVQILTALINENQISPKWFIRHTVAQLFRDRISFEYCVEEGTYQLPIGA